MTAHLDVDAFLGFLAVKQAFDIKVRAPCVLVNRRTDLLPLAGDDHVGVDGCCNSFLTNDSGIVHYHLPHFETKLFTNNKAHSVKAAMCRN